MRAWVPASALHSLAMKIHTCSPNTREVEAGDSEVQDYPELDSEFEARLNQPPCLKQKNVFYVFITKMAGEQNSSCDLMASGQRKPRLGRDLERSLAGSAQCLRGRGSSSFVLHGCNAHFFLSPLIRKILMWSKWWQEVASGFMASSGYGYFPEISCTGNPRFPVCIIHTSHGGWD